MDQSFFKSFWKLLASQLKNLSEVDSEKLMTDLFSSTFLKALETADSNERTEFANSLRDACDLVAKTNAELPDAIYRLNRACLLVLVGWINTAGVGGACDGEYDLINAAIDSSLSVDESINLLATPWVGKAVSAFLTPEGKHRLVQIIESQLVPRLSTQDEKIKLLTFCQFMASDIQAIMTETIEGVTHWRRGGGTDSVDPVLMKLVDSPRVHLLFRQLPGIPVLKERFLVTLAIALRAEPNSPYAEQAKKAFFFVPSVGVVMDRWLDKELQKFNKDVVHRLGGFGNDLRDALANVFCSEEWVPIPLGFEEAILRFIKEKADPESDFKELPCVVTAETVCTVLRQFSSWFEIVGESRARLTPAASAAPAAAAPVPAPQPAPESTGPEDLVDVLLKELLNRLPEHAFLSRPYPSKVQPGVYRFGTREVTFHTKSGRLQVFRVGGYVSESDAVEFLAREFSVPSDKLRSSVQGTVSAAKKPTTMQGMRRPMEWENVRLLVRLVKRGLKAKDQIWRQGWESVCITAGADPSSPAGVAKGILQRFLEQNMAHAVRQDWARDLLYYDERKPGVLDDESSTSDSDVRRQPVVSLPSPPPGTVVRPPTQPPEAHPNFKTRLCLNFPLGRCTRGPACAYAHGEAELRAGASGMVAPVASSQHQFYKTRMCQLFTEGRCTRGVGCNYAHSEEERQAYSSQGVVKRDIRTSDDIRLAAKAEVQSRGRDRSRSRDRRSRY